MRRAAIGILITAWLGGCDPRGVRGTLPPAEVLGRPPNWAGDWVGEVGGVSGRLELTALSRERYYGRFRGDRVNYVLDATPVSIETAGEFTSRATNQLTFRWQDGQGSHGHGWLMIDTTGASLTGSFGFGRERAGAGRWTLLR